MKVLLDASVLFSAFVVRGTCAQVLEAVIARHELVISESLLAEVLDRLRSKVGAQADDLRRFELLLRAVGDVVEPSVIDPPVCRDPDDDAVLGAARAGGADVLVTGDRDLLVLAALDECPIVSPREFLVDFGG